MLVGTGNSNLNKILYKNVNKKPPLYLIDMIPKRLKNYPEYKDYPTIDQITTWVK